MPQATNESLKWRPMNVPGFITRAGPLLAARSAEGWRYAVQTGSHHANPAGAVHGGVIASLADHAMALIAWEEAGRRPVATVQMDTRFLNAVRPGERLEAVARLRHRSRSLLHLDADVTVAGRLVATTSAVLKLTGSGSGAEDGNGH